VHEDSADVACEGVLENCVRGFRGRWKGDVPMASVSDPSATLSNIDSAENGEQSEKEGVGAHVGVVAIYCLVDRT